MLNKKHRSTCPFKSKQSNSSHSLCTERRCIVWKDLSRHFGYNRLDLLSSDYAELFLDVHEGGSGNYEKLSKFGHESLETYGDILFYEAFHKKSEDIIDIFGPSSPSGGNRSHQLVSKELQHLIWMSKHTDHLVANSTLYTFGSLHCETSQFLKSRYDIIKFVKAAVGYGLMVNKPERTPMWVSSLVEQFDDLTEETVETNKYRKWILRDLRDFFGIRSDFIPPEIEAILKSEPSALQQYRSYGAKLLMNATVAHFADLVSKDPEEMIDDLKNHLTADTDVRQWAFFQASELLQRDSLSLFASSYLCLRPILERGLPNKSAGSNLPSSKSKLKKHVAIAEKYNLRRMVITPNGLKDSKNSTPSESKPAPECPAPANLSRAVGNQEVISRTATDEHYAETFEALIGVCALIGRKFSERSYASAARHMGLNISSEISDNNNSNSQQKKEDHVAMWLDDLVRRIRFLNNTVRYYQISVAKHSGLDGIRNIFGSPEDRFKSYNVARGIQAGAINSFTNGNNKNNNGTAEDGSNLTTGLTTLSPYDKEFAWESFVRGFERRLPFWQKSRNGKMNHPFGENLLKELNGLGSDRDEEIESEDEETTINKRFVEWVRGRRKQIGISPSLFGGAGVDADGKFENISEEEWRKTLIADITKSGAGKKFSGDIDGDFDGFDGLKVYGSQDLGADWLLNNTILDSGKNDRLTNYFRTLFGIDSSSLCYGGSLNDFKKGLGAPRWGMGWADNEQQEGEKDREYSDGAASQLDQLFEVLGGPSYDEGKFVLPTYDGKSRLLVRDCYIPPAGRQAEFIDGENGFGQSMLLKELNGRFAGWFSRVFVTPFGHIYATIGGQKGKFNVMGPQLLQGWKVTLRPVNLDELVSRGAALASGVQQETSQQWHLLKSKLENASAAGERGSVEFAEWLRKLGKDVVDVLPGGVVTDGQGGYHRLEMVKDDSIVADLVKRMETGLDGVRRNIMHQLKGFSLVTDGWKNGELIPWWDEKRRHELIRQLFGISEDIFESYGGPLGERIAIRGSSDDQKSKTSETQLYPERITPGMTFDLVYVTPYGHIYAGTSPPEQNFLERALLPAQSPVLKLLIGSRVVFAPMTPEDPPPPKGVIRIIDQGGRILKPELISDPSVTKEAAREAETDPGTRVRNPRARRLQGYALDVRRIRAAALVPIGLPVGPNGESPSRLVGSPFLVYNTDDTVSTKNGKILFGSPVSSPSRFSNSIGFGSSRGDLTALAKDAVDTARNPSAASAGEFIVSSASPDYNRLHVKFKDSSKRTLADEGSVDGRSTAYIGNDNTFGNDSRSRPHTFATSTHLDNNYNNNISNNNYSPFFTPGNSVNIPSTSPHNIKSFQKNLSPQLPPADEVYSKFERKMSPNLIIPSRESELFLPLSERSTIDERQVVNGHVTKNDFDKGEYLSHKSSSVRNIIRDHILYPKHSYNYGNAAAQTHFPSPPIRQKSEISFSSNFGNFSDSDGLLPRYSHMDNNNNTFESPIAKQNVKNMTKIYENDNQQTANLSFNSSPSLSRPLVYNHNELHKYNSPLSPVFKEVFAPHLPTPPSRVLSSPKMYEQRELNNAFDPKTKDASIPPLSFAQIMSNSPNENLTSNQKLLHSLNSVDQGNNFTPISTTRGSISSLAFPILDPKSTPLNSSFNHSSVLAPHSLNNAGLILSMNQAVSPFGQIKSSAELELIDAQKKRIEVLENDLKEMQRREIDRMIKDYSSGNIEEEKHLRNPTTSLHKPAVSSPVNLFEKFNSTSQDAQPNKNAAHRYYEAVNLRLNLHDIGIGSDKVVSSSNSVSSTLNTFPMAQIKPHPNFDANNGRNKIYDNQGSDGCRLYIAGDGKFADMPSEVIAKLKKMSGSALRHHNDDKCQNKGLLAKQCATGEMDDEFPFINQKDENMVSGLNFSLDNQCVPELVARIESPKRNVACDVFLEKKSPNGQLHWRFKASQIDQKESKP